MNCVICISLMMISFASACHVQSSTYKAAAVNSAFIFKLNGTHYDGIVAKMSQNYIVIAIAYCTHFEGYY